LGGGGLYILMVTVTFSKDEQFIIDTLKKNGNSIKYSRLEKLCASQTMGNTLTMILKDLKEKKKAINYDGKIASQQSMIKLI
jgi:hypothetical protein